MCLLFNLRQWVCRARLPTFVFVSGFELLGHDPHVCIRFVVLAFGRPLSCFRTVTRGNCRAPAPDRIFSTLHFFFIWEYTYIPQGSGIVYITISLTGSAHDSHRIAQEGPRGRWGGALNVREETLFLCARMDLVTVCSE